MLPGESIEESVINKTDAKQSIVLFPGRHIVNTKMPPEKSNEGNPQNRQNHRKQKNTNNNKSMEASSLQISEGGFSETSEIAQGDSKEAPRRLPGGSEETPRDSKELQEDFRETPGGVSGRRRWRGGEKKSRRSHRKAGQDTGHEEAKRKK